MAQRLTEEDMEEEIIAAYSLVTRRTEIYDTIFNMDGTIQDHLPMIGISVGYDMGWQKRCGGRRYDSLSGHDYFIGLLNNFVICYVCYSKHCKMGDLVRIEGEAIPVHDCPKNYEGKSSKSMEADGALRLFNDIFKKYKNKVYIKEFVSDDDSSTRKTLRCKIEDGGDLPDNMKEPIFLRDVNHHIKCMAKPFFALAALSNRLSIATKLDALRIKRNIGWYVRAYRSSATLMFDDFVKNAKAPVARHFNDHQYCHRS